MTKTARKRALGALAVTAVTAAAVTGCATGAGKAAAANAPAPAPASHARTASHGGTTVTAQSATNHTGTVQVTIWSVNSDGPDFREVLTGAVGDYGPGVTVFPDGRVDPSHTSQLELNMSRGSFRLNVAELDTRFVQAITHGSYDPATCSVHATFTGDVPVVPGSGTGAYRGITGTFTLTASLDEVDRPGTNCTGTVASSPFLAQLITIAGTGTVRQ